MSKGIIAPASNYSANLSAGLIPGQHPMIMAGKHLHLTTDVEGNLWGDDDPLVYLTTAERINIASDNVADTGPLQILVLGLDGANNFIIELVNLNGLTPVLTALSFMLITALVLTGTGVTNTGTISAVSADSVELQAVMEPDWGLSQHGFYRIRAGREAVITSLEFNASKLSGGQAPIVEFKLKARNTLTSPWVTIADRRMDTSSGIDLVIATESTGILVAGADIQFSAISNETNTIAYARLSGVEYDV